jgi:small nuclear ribonucleoprotein E
MPPKRVKKVTTLPINVIFSHLQKKNRVKIWLYEDSRMALEGQIIGFDEYMNMTLENAVECDLKTGKREDVGRILLKGDAITLLQNANPVEPTR